MEITRGVVMEFMGISVGVLALICALVLLLGVRGTRKILGWSSRPTATRGSRSRRARVDLADAPA